MKAAIPLAIFLMALTACAGSPTGRAITGCVNGTAVNRLCEADACENSAQDNACCKNAVQYCVYEGQCYEQNVLWRSKPDYYPKGMFCFRLVQGFETTTLPRWFDCDGAEGAYCSNRSYCNFRAARSGEEGVGEYNYLAKRECCGDDEGEYYIEGEDGSAACCSAPDRKVEDEVCILPEVVVEAPQEEESAPLKEPVVGPEVDEGDYVVVPGEHEEPAKIDMYDEPKPAPKQPNFFQKIAKWFMDLFG